MPCGGTFGLMLSTSRDVKWKEDIKSPAVASATALSSVLSSPRPASRSNVNRLVSSLLKPSGLSIPSAPSTGTSSSSPINTPVRTSALTTASKPVLTADATSPPVRFTVVMPPGTVLLTDAHGLAGRDRVTTVLSSESRAGRGDSMVKQREDDDIASISSVNEQQQQQQQQHKALKLNLAEERSHQTNSTVDADNVTEKSGEVTTASTTSEEVLTMTAFECKRRRRTLSFLGGARERDTETSNKQSLQDWNKLASVLRHTRVIVQNTAIPEVNGEYRLENALNGAGVFEKKAVGGGGRHAIYRWHLQFNDTYSWFISFVPSTERFPGSKRDVNLYYGSSNSGVLPYHPEPTCAWFSMSPQTFTTDVAIRSSIVTVKPKERLSLPTKTVEPSQTSPPVEVTKVCAMLTANPRDESTDIAIVDERRREMHAEVKTSSPDNKTSLSASEVGRRSKTIKFLAKERQMMSTSEGRNLFNPAGSEHLLKEIGDTSIIIRGASISAINGQYRCVGVMNGAGVFEKNCDRGGRHSIYRLQLTTSNLKMSWFISLVASGVQPGSPSDENLYYGSTPNTLTVQVPTPHCQWFCMTEDFESDLGTTSVVNKGTRKVEGIATSNSPHDPHLSNHVETCVPTSNLFVEPAGSPSAVTPAAAVVLVEESSPPAKYCNRSDLEAGSPMRDKSEWSRTVSALKRNRLEQLDCTRANQCNVVESSDIAHSLQDTYLVVDCKSHPALSGRYLFVGTLNSAGWFERKTADVKRFVVYRLYSQCSDAFTWFLSVVPPKGDARPGSQRDVNLYFCVSPSGAEDVAPERGWRGISSCEDSLSTRLVRRDSQRRADSPVSSGRGTVAMSDSPDSAGLPVVQSRTAHFSMSGGRRSPNPYCDSRPSKRSRDVSPPPPPVPFAASSAQKQPVNETPSHRLQIGLARVVSDMCGREETNSALPAQVAEYFDALVSDYQVDLSTTLAVFQLVSDCLQELRRQQKELETSSGERSPSRLPCEFGPDEPYDELCLKIVCRAFPLISPSTTKLLMFSVLAEIQQMAPKLSAGYSVVPVFFVCDLANSHAATPRATMRSSEKRLRSRSPAREVLSSSREARFTEDCVRFVGGLFPTLRGRDAPQSEMFSTLLTAMATQTRIDRETALSAGLVIREALGRLADRDREERIRHGPPRDTPPLCTFSKETLERCEMILRNIFRSVSTREVESHLRDVTRSLTSLGVPCEGVVPLKCFCELLQEEHRKSCRV
eukprot:gene24367-30706_t